MLEPFTDSMKRHWTQTLGLTGSDALTEGWAQLLQATDRLKAGTERWQVVQLPTGSGKTEALKILCGMQDPLCHPGVLIVTKFRSEADRLAQDINRLSASRIARSVHQEARGTFDELGFSPVLVTTHSAYRLALLEIADTGLTHKADRLLTYYGGRRSWLIIDESFDWADTYSLLASNLRAMSGDLVRAMQGDLREAAEQLYEFSCRLTESDRSDRALEAECVDMLLRINLRGLRAGVAGRVEDAFAQWPELAPAMNTQAVTNFATQSKKQYLNHLAQLQTIARIGHAWTSRRGGRTQLHSSRSLIGTDGVRGIILDATAEIDPIYSVMRNQVDVLPRPLGIRTYRNVSLHVSYGHKVGKEHLARNAGKEWAIVWGDLSKRLVGKHVLVCAHKDARKVIEQYGPNDGHVRFDNWGNLDGRNDYNKCEAVILFGLPYLDDIEPAQRFIAHQGRQSSEWFGESREHEEHADIRTALGDGFIARSVVQAINRIQCRNTIDAKGNCPITDIYLLLPRGNTGTAVVRAIKKQMPGIRTADWVSGATRRMARKIPSEVKLASHFEVAAPGYYSKSEIVKTLRISPSSLERIAPKLRAPSSELAKKLDGYGVRYHFQTGRGKEAYFIKQ